MLRDYLKYQGAIYLSEEDLQGALKEDGAILIIDWNRRKNVYKEEEEEEEENP